jgi:hypothetical protein
MCENSCYPCSCTALTDGPLGKDWYQKWNFSGIIFLVKFHQVPFFAVFNSNDLEYKLIKAGVFFSFSRDCSSTFDFCFLIRTKVIISVFSGIRFSLLNTRSILPSTAFLFVVVLHALNFEICHVTIKQFFHIVWHLVLNPNFCRSSPPNID